MRLYKALIWTKDSNEPGRRVTVEAKSLQEARDKLAAEFGKDTFVSFWNEEDAARPRQ